jgi:hypothetical protein
MSATKAPRVAHVHDCYETWEDAEMESKKLKRPIRVRVEGIEATVFPSGFTRIHSVEPTYEELRDAHADLMFESRRGN